MPGRSEEKDHISQAASDALSRPAVVGGFFSGNLWRLGDCDEKPKKCMVDSNSF